MGAALDAVKQGYPAFGRHDIPALLELVVDEVDWKSICPASLPYSGLRRNPAEVGEFFAAIGQVEDITVFEPKEFIEAGEKRHGTGLPRSFCPGYETKVSDRVGPRVHSAKW